MINFVKLGLTCTPSHYTPLLIKIAGDGTIGCLICTACGRVGFMSCEVQVPSWLARVVFPTSCGLFFDCVVAQLWHNTTSTTASQIAKREKVSVLLGPRHSEPAPNHHHWNIPPIPLLSFSKPLDRPVTPNTAYAIT